MKKILLILVLMSGLILIQHTAMAQCSICSKSVIQMGSKPAQGFNAGILFLMAIPFVSVGVVAFKWWKSTKAPQN